MSVNKFDREFKKGEKKYSPSEISMNGYPDLRYNKHIIDERWREWNNNAIKERKNAQVKPYPNPSCWIPSEPDKLLNIGITCDFIANEKSKIMGRCEFKNLMSAIFNELCLKRFNGGIRIICKDGDAVYWFAKDSDLSICRILGDVLTVPRDWYKLDFAIIIKNKKNKYYDRFIEHGEKNDCQQYILNY